MYIELGRSLLCHANAFPRKAGAIACHEGLQLTMLTYTAKFTALLRTQNDLTGSQ